MGEPLDAAGPALPGSAAPAVPAAPARPLTFARVFWHFCLGGWSASLVGLVALPRILARYGVSEARIDGWSLAVWIGLLAAVLTPLAHDAWQDWVETTRGG